MQKELSEDETGLTQGSMDTVLREGREREGLIERASLSLEQDTDRREE